MYKVGDKLKCLQWEGYTFKEGEIVEIESIEEGSFAPEYRVKDGRLFPEGAGIWELSIKINPIIEAALKKYDLELNEEFTYDGDTFRFTIFGLELLVSDKWEFDSYVGFNELLKMNITKGPFIPKKNSGDVYVVDAFFEEGYCMMNTLVDWEPIELAISRGVTFYKTKQEVIEEIKEVGW